MGGEKGRGVLGGEEKDEGWVLGMRCAQVRRKVDFS